ncbi:MAG: DUF4446 family protein [Candidatus Moranbacteria bacterium]|nr:DUF4446 family protein [Candidatus Moranbacteria bacterium]
METNTLYFLFILLFVIASGSLFFSIWLLQRVRRMQDFFDTVLTGRDVKDLESLIKEISKKSDKLDEDIEDLFDASNQINKIARKGLSRIGIVKYNPFGEKGGRKDSFALAIINSNSRGVLLSTLDTENGTKVYLKEINKGGSDSPLTDEEKEAVKLAMG